MYERINYLAVGIFVILFGVIASYFAFWLAKENINSNSVNEYVIYFNESVDGLNKDSTVKLNGVDAGRVKSINIDLDDPSKVVVRVLISKKLKITKDMYAVMQGQGLTGLRYINIIGGKSKESIAPNTKDSIIPSKQSTLLQLSNASSTLAKRVEVLFSDTNLNNLSKILQNGAELSQRVLSLEEHLSALIGEANRTKQYNLSNLVASLKDINSTIKAYKDLANIGQKTLSGVNNKLPALINSIKKSVKSLERTSNLIGRTIHRGDYNLKRILTPAVSELRSLSNDYRELGDEIREMVQNPAGALINGKSLSRGPGE